MRLVCDTLTGITARPAGHAMGEEALLALYKATFSARSMTYSEVNEIDIGAVYGILEAYPQFKRLLRVYAIRKVRRPLVSGIQAHAC